MAEFRGQVGGDQAVLWGPAGHGEDIALEELALERRRTLAFEVPRHGQTLDTLCQTTTP